jgi:P27 family predicted phage terminase small subunit
MSLRINEAHINIGDIMTRPGPAPTPTHLRIIRGDRKDRINTNEPTPPKTKPKCPKWLSNEAQKIWKRTSKQLEAMGLLFEADQDILNSYCIAVDTYQQATKLVNEQGVLVEGRRDDFVTNPAVRIQRDQATLIRMLGSELGLTPSSRTRLKALDSDDDTKDFLD